MEIWEEGMKGRETGRLRKSERLKLMMGVCGGEGREGRKGRSRRKDRAREREREREREVAVG
jgi:hypothetical protein